VQWHTISSSCVSLVQELAGGGAAGDGGGDLRSPQAPTSLQVQRAGSKSAGGPGAQGTGVLAWAGEEHSNAPADVHQGLRPATGLKCPLLSMPAACPPACLPALPVCLPACLEMLACDTVVTPLPRYGKTETSHHPCKVAPALKAAKHNRQLTISTALLLIMQITWKQIQHACSLLVVLVCSDGISRPEWL